MKSEEINHLARDRSACHRRERCPTVRGQALSEFPLGYDRMYFMPQNNYRNLKVEMMYAGHTFKLIFSEWHLKYFYQYEWNAYTSVNCMYL